MVAAFIASVPFFAAIPGAAQVLPSVARPVAIDIRSEPITAFDIRDPSRRRFGLLEFRGGLVLRSAHSSFGGISAIRVAADGTQFIALTDRGWWFRGRLLYEGTRPSGIADAEMAPMLGPDGKPLAARGWYDTESIAEDGGTLLVDDVSFGTRPSVPRSGPQAHTRPLAPCLQPARRLERLLT